MYYAIPTRPPSFSRKEYIVRKVKGGDTSLSTFVKYLKATEDF